MKSSTSEDTANVLRTHSAIFGVPEIVVSDNRPQLVSEEFEYFLKRNGIRHITSAPYHPSTNGLTERFVQTFKKGISGFKEKVPLQTKVDIVLLAYRNAPHGTTGQPPVVLLMGRRLRSR
ncbi:uncharacterized protein K02A2.6-like [Nematostella vectensis]|uniref:uncharacterized protein K02A2.6-like n=1 Tax=Nematostella vectensis TaxID=45351 RepID=UPI0020779A5D|nr:uncharacterized protein K02A2.6-like [Nematostella vectensis]